MIFTTLYDSVDPNDSLGRSYKQINEEKNHSIPNGALVEINSTGVRLFVAIKGRDCDQKPLYWLSHEKDSNAPLFGGYSEESLTVIN